MPKHVSTTAELRAMSATDLRKDMIELKGSVAKNRLSVHAGTEKDTAAFARSKKQLARMLTVLNQIEKTSTMPTSAKAPAGRLVPAPRSSRKSEVGSASKKS